MIESALQVPERAPDGAAPFRAPQTQHFGRGAIERVAEEAQRLGANAVVGVDLDYGAIGSKESMMMVTASGTAVTLA